jgi:phage N-6-adenine-methyltransferase
MSYLQAVTSSATDQWATPTHFYDSLNREFGPFDLDVCADAGNAKCARFYTAADDGLAQPWTGRCWMNPPYGRGIDAWMRKAARSGAEGARVVALVPARVDTRWWRASEAAASLVRIVPGRLKFGDGTAPAPFPSAVFVFGALPGRHGTDARQCHVCSGWWFPARRDARTCSTRCRQAMRRSRIRLPKCDKGSP